MWNRVEWHLCSGNQYLFTECNFALENLCTLQFGGSTNISLVTAQVAELKAALTHLLLVALEKVSDSFHNKPCCIESVTTFKYVYFKS